MSGGHGKLMGVYEGFGGRRKRLYRPCFSAHEMNGLGEFGRLKSIYGVL